MMEANKEKIKSVRQPRQTVFDKLSALKKANDTLTQEVELKTETLTYAADLLIAAEEKVDKLTQEVKWKREVMSLACIMFREVNEKVKKLQSTVAEQKGEIERLLVKTGDSSEDNQVITSSMKTVSTATQTSVNIPYYNANSLQPAEAADKIRKLEEQLDEKRKYITKLKNKLTSYRLRREPDLWPNYNYLADLEEYPKAQEQATIEVGLNDAPITKDQIKTDLLQKPTELFHQTTCHHVPQQPERRLRLSRRNEERGAGKLTMYCAY
jgi:chromosome segregation ATPase